MAKNDSYMLKVGEAGAERLAVLHEIYAPSSQQLLHKEIAPGQHVLEIGCGTGNMTSWLARQVTESGKVLAIDISLEQINLAKAKTDAEGLKNIEYRVLSVFDVETISDQFDLIYSRFVLMHLVNSQTALEKLYSRLKKDGRMICEEAIIDKNCSYPNTTAYQEFRQICKRLQELKNLDTELPCKLYRYFQELGLDIEYVNQTQPVLYTDKQRQYPLLAFLELKSTLLDYNLLSPQSADFFLTEIQKNIVDKTIMLSAPFIMQLIGKK